MIKRPAVGDFDDCPRLAQGELYHIVVEFVSVLQWGAFFSSVVVGPILRFTCSQVLRLLADACQKVLVCVVLHRIVSGFDITVKKEGDDSGLVSVQTAGQLPLGLS